MSSFRAGVLGCPWVSVGTPDGAKWLYLFGRFQVSFGTPSTTLGGVECQ